MTVGLHSNESKKERKEGNRGKVSLGFPWFSGGFLALNSRGFNGKRTEHQIGGGVHLDRHPRPCCSDRYMIEKNSGRDERAGIFSSQPPEISLFLAVLLYNFSFKYFRHSLVLN